MTVSDRQLFRVQQIVLSGLATYGPFPTVGEAETWVERVKDQDWFVSDDWCIHPLWTPPVEGDQPPPLA